jgi:hypothetical protein
VLAGTGAAMIRSAQWLAQEVIELAPSAQLLKFFIEILTGKSAGEEGSSRPAVTSRKGILLVS